MKLQPIKQLGMDLTLGEYKGVRMTLWENDGNVSIYSCESKNRGKGEVQEAIQYLKDNYKIVYGSVPLNETMKHIYQKMGVVYKK